MTGAFLLLLLGFVPTADSASNAEGIHRIAWLQGCWELSANGRSVEEHWFGPRGRTMVGAGRTVQGDALIEYELILVREEGDRLAYEAHPSGQPAAVFLSREVSESTVIFENPDHDFPQRIGYQMKSSSSLIAWIEGTQGGKVRRKEFPYNRVACEGSR